MMNEAPDYAFYRPPVYVGKYCLGGEYGLCINFEKKPSWWHRYWMKTCLGWTWHDGV